VRTNARVIFDFAIRRAGRWFGNSGARGLTSGWYRDGARCEPQWNRVTDRRTSFANTD